MSLFEGSMNGMGDADSDNGGYGVPDADDGGYGVNLDAQNPDSGGLNSSSLLSGTSLSSLLGSAVNTATSVAQAAISQALDSSNGSDNGTAIAGAGSVPPATTSTSSSTLLILGAVAAGVYLMTRD